MTEIFIYSVAIKKKAWKMYFWWKLILGVDTKGSQMWPIRLVIITTDFSPFWCVFCKSHYSFQEPNYFHPCSLSLNLEPTNMIENGSNHFSCWVFRGIINEYKVLGEFTMLFKYYKKKAQEESFGTQRKDLIITLD